jgi:hypothetical protein
VLTSTVAEVLTATAASPVLVDLGASGTPPPAWGSISRHSVYIGFDPDRRDLQPDASSPFGISHIVPAAVIADDSRTARFYLTSSPYCSSTLEPDHDSLQAYLMAPLFVVESEAEVPATTLGRALHELGIDHVDWYKADTQGTDLRIFKSLSDRVRMGVLAVDVEPGLISVYRGEDLFVETHEYLVAQGFWLSRLDVKGSVRITEASRRELDASTAEFAERTAACGLRESPAWCEARYLRTTDSLADQEERAWVLSWVFALVDQQPGFALDLARGYEGRFGRNETAFMMRSAALAAANAPYRQIPLRTAWRRLVPVAIRRAVFKARTWLSPTS